MTRRPEKNATQPAFTFTSLLANAEKAIQAAKLVCEEFAGEPINWAAIKVTHIEHWMDDRGDSGYRVYIDECSPNCPKLASFIAGYIDEAGINCEVRTEW